MLHLARGICLSFPFSGRHGPRAGADGTTSKVFLFFNVENKPHICRPRSFIIHKLRYFPMTATPASTPPHRRFPGWTALKICGPYMGLSSERRKCSATSIGIEDFEDCKSSTTDSHDTLRLGPLSFGWLKKRWDQMTYPTLPVRQPPLTIYDITTLQCPAWLCTTKSSPPPPPLRSILQFYF